MNRMQALPWPLRVVYYLVLRVHRSFQRELKKQFNRYLPFSEGLIDRWQRAREVGFGSGSSVYDSSYLFGDVVVGKDVWIGPLSVLDGSGGLTIEDNCAVGAGVHIYTHDTLQKTLVDTKIEPEYAPVTIERNCYIGAQAMIAKGVTIGHHSVIGAQSFVNTAIPPYSVAVGSPARVVGKVVMTDTGARLEYC